MKKIINLIARLRNAGRIMSINPFGQNTMLTKRMVRALKRQGIDWYVDQTTPTRELFYDKHKQNSTK